SGGPGDAAAQGRGPALGEPGRALAVGPIHARTFHGEDAPADDIVERGASLLERPPDRFDRQIGLSGPVTRRLRLTGRIHRGAAADPDPVFNLHRARIAARLLALLRRVDVATGPGRADDRLRLDLDEHFRVNERRDAQQCRGRPYIAERLEPGARVVRGPAQIGQVGLGVDQIFARGPRLLQGREDRVHDASGLSVHVALAFDDAP